MLKFRTGYPVYKAEREGIQFLGTGFDGEVMCHVTKQAILACADLDDAPPRELVSIFILNRQFFEDIANLEYAAGAREAIFIDRFHLEQPAFVHHLAQARRSERGRAIA